MTRMMNLSRSSIRNAFAVAAAVPTLGLGAAALAAVLTLVLPSAALAKRSPSGSRIYPTTAKPFGETYAAWSAHWWQWALAIPPVSGVHPFIADPAFQCDVNQSGPVWFLG